LSVSFFFNPQTVICTSGPCLRKSGHSTGYPQVATLSAKLWVSRENLLQVFVSFFKPQNMFYTSAPCLRKNEQSYASELRSCVKVEVAVPDSPYGP